MSLTVFHGLPTHVLLAHFVVVLVPLTALALLVCVVWPGAGRRMGLVLPLLALVTLALVPFTTHAGEWLRSRLPPSGPIDRHAGLGEGLLPWTVALAVMAAAVWWLTRHGATRTAAPTDPPGAAPTDRPGAGRVGAGRAGVVPVRTARALRVLAALLAVTAAVGAVVTVYRIGDSGARAVWNGVVTRSADGADHSPLTARPTRTGH
jgi:hypothetical protein